MSDKQDIKNIGEFEFDMAKPLGQGAWGEVFRGRQKSLNRSVAIKFLKKELTVDQDFVKRFKREAECLAKLTNEHIIQVYSAGEYEGAYYFIMEFVQGVPLSKFIEKAHKFSYDEVLYVSSSVAKALKAAFESPAKIVHRDIKPSNIMVSMSSSILAPQMQTGVSESIAAVSANLSDSTIKVMDFGLAKLSTEDTEATIVGTVIGTPKYISPEQGLGNVADIRSDIYSLGLVMFEMATGQLPFEGETALSLIRHHIYDTAMAPSQIRADMPKELEAIIMKCLHKDPNRRYQTPVELINDLTAFQHNKPPALAMKDAASSAIEATMISGVGRVRKTQRVLLYAGIGVGVLAIAAVAWFILRPPPQVKPGPYQGPSGTRATIPFGSMTTGSMVSPIEVPTPIQPEITDEEIDEAIAKVEGLLNENKLQEAWSEAAALKRKAPDVLRVKQLYDKVDRALSQAQEARNKVRLAEALINEPPVRLMETADEKLTPDQRRYNYIIGLLEEKKYSDARVDVKKLIDSFDDTVSPAAIYFQMKLLNREKKFGYIDEMDSLYMSLNAQYTQSSCIELAQSLLDQAREDYEKGLYEQCLEDADNVASPDNKIKIFEAFVKQYPSSPYLSEIKVKIEELREDIVRLRQDNYDKCLTQAKDLETQGLFLDAFKQLIEAKEYTSDFSEVTGLIGDLEINYLASKGIAPQGDQRDSTSGLHQSITSHPDEAGMILVPAGKFTMGNRNGEPDEQPTHSVDVDDYYMDLYEVTNARFSAFVKVTNHKTDAEKKGYGWIWQDLEPQKVNGASWKDPRGDKTGIKKIMDHPVVQISWPDAAAYAKWAGKRLPTEAEWEKAARGTQGYVYPWGNQWKMKHCYYVLLAGDGAVSVNEYALGKSPYGCYQMAGNVFEWCHDWYAQDYYRKADAKDNPRGPQSGRVHVIRGGSWIVSRKLLATTLRGQGIVNDNIRCWSDYIGFRCVKDTSKDLIGLIKK